MEEWKKWKKCATRSAKQMCNSKRKTNLQLEVRSNVLFWFKCSDYVWLVSVYASQSKSPECWLHDPPRNHPPPNPGLWRVHSAHPSATVLPSRVHLYPLDGRPEVRFIRTPQLLCNNDLFCLFKWGGYSLALLQRIKRTESQSSQLHPQSQASYLTVWLKGLWNLSL